MKADNSMTLAAATKLRDTREVIQRGGARYNPKPRTAKPDRA